jgi:hypothetical protein
MLTTQVLLRPESALLQRSAQLLPHGPTASARGHLCALVQRRPRLLGRQRVPAGRVLPAKVPPEEGARDGRDPQGGGVDAQAGARGGLRHGVSAHTQARLVPSLSLVWLSHSTQALCILVWDLMEKPQTSKAARV